MNNYFWWGMVSRDVDEVITEVSSSAFLHSCSILMITDILNITDTDDHRHIDDHQHIHDHRHIDHDRHIGQRTYSASGRLLLASTLSHILPPITAVAEGCRLRLTSSRVTFSCNSFGIPVHLMLIWQKQTFNGCKMVARWLGPGTPSI